MNSDIIHLRRADGRDWDGLLHVNPDLKTKGLIMLYNPLNKKITRTIKVPLYYTGLTKSAMVKEKEEAFKTYPLDREFEIELKCSLEPGSYTWFVFQ